MQGILKATVSLKVHGLFSDAPGGCKGATLIYHGRVCHPSPVQPI